MNYFELDKNEKDILEDFEKGNLKKSSTKDKSRYKEYARETLNKSKTIITTQAIGATISLNTK